MNENRSIIDGMIDEREAREPGFRAAVEELRPWHEVRSAMIRARLSAGLTQEQLAEALGTKQPAVGRWERGTRTPTLEVLYRVAKALNVEFRVTPQKALIVQEYAPEEAPSREVPAAAEEVAVPEARHDAPEQLAG